MNDILNRMRDLFGKESGDGARMNDDRYDEEDYEDDYEDEDDGYGYDIYDDEEADDEDDNYVEDDYDDEEGWEDWDDDWEDDLDDEDEYRDADHYARHDEPRHGREHRHPRDEEEFPRSDAKHRPHQRQRGPYKDFDEDDSEIRDWDY